MPQNIIPYEPCNIPNEIQSELNRRKINRGLVYDRWDDTTNDWSRYKGPMTPWVRFCSNGAGRPGRNIDVLNILNANDVSLEYYDKQGFVLFGGKNFYSSFGFNNSGESDSSIIGYMPDGQPHIIDNNLLLSTYPIHVPSPEIVNIDVIIQKELFRRATVEWTCFSKAQLEYMTPYFLVPGITCILEWGWNLYNESSLVDLRNTTLLKKYNDNPYSLYTKNILMSKGNYDVLFGKITHFEWEVDGNRFKCKTEITSQDRLYAGLIVDSNSAFINKELLDSSNNIDQEITPFGNLKKFLKDIIPAFKNIKNSENLSSNISNILKDVEEYIIQYHPDNWREYIYGVFYGRDSNILKSNSYDSKYKNNNDFDVKNNNDLWLNFGLVIECINKHHEQLKSVNNNQLFRIDIDTVVISGHPNLISCDGSILLIPNAAAPKYFYGEYGYLGLTSNIEKYEILKHCTNAINTSVITKKQAEESSKAGIAGAMADYRLKSICLQTGGSYRDNIDELINMVRYNMAPTVNGTYAFPFVTDTQVNGLKYKKLYSGLLRNLYINAKYLQTVIDDCNTYKELIEKILSDISSASAGFWDLRLISSSGTFENEDENKPVKMTIVDYNFLNESNFTNNDVYSFDYADADSLLLGFSFKPTLGDATAIRTIYAQTNNPQNKIILTNGDGEMMDYIFKDRLALDTESKPPGKRTNYDHREYMKMLQQPEPPKILNVYQMTTKRNDFVVIRRLAIPPENSYLLRMLLDDGDKDNNPKYLGIMPNIQATFNIQGIGGLRTFMVFLVKNLPNPYSEKNIIFRIIDVQETINDSTWNTTITAGIIPLNDYIAKKLNIKL